MKKIILLLVFCFSIQTVTFAATATQTPQPTTNNGRYVIVIHPQFRADQYLLDTKTGKVWQQTVDSDGNIYWKATRYHNADGTTKYIPQ